MAQQTAYSGYGLVTAVAVTLAVGFAPAATAAQTAPIGAISSDSPVQVAQIFTGSRKKSKEAAELHLRVDGVEQEIRNLTGQLEELTFQLRQLQDQLRRMQEDNEFRFQELEGGTSRRGSLQPSARSTDLANAATQAGTVAETDSRHTLGTLPRSYAEDEAGTQGRATGGPLDLSALARDEAPQAQESAEAEPTAVALSSGEPAQDYEAAYSRVLQGDYAGSESLFREFLKKHPDHHLAGNAQYWLGESLFARGLYRDAADAFLKSYSDYPGSSKGPDSLLKLGLALAGLGEQAAACATYGELLTKFPDAPDSVKQRASVEQRVIGCAT
ncbi:MAG: tol-pal system protein YbgF [Pseudomonadota bacterium]